MNDPIIPSTIPSITNGNFILIFDAPTRRIIYISCFLENIVSFIVLIIKNIVTTTRARAAIKVIFSTALNALSIFSTNPSPYCTLDTLSRAFISSAVFLILFTSITFIVYVSLRGFSVLSQLSNTSFKLS